MPDLHFQVLSASPEKFSATPLLKLQLAITPTQNPTPIHSILLRTQLRIEPALRKYSDQQRQALHDLFGPAHLWAQSLRPLLWCHVTTLVPAFDDYTTADLEVPCSFDLTLAATKYFDALGNEGDIPLALLFSGTIFYQSPDQSLQVAPISWNNDASWKLPAKLWRELIDRHYADTAFLPLRRDTVEKLRHFKTQNHHFTLDDALTQILQNSSEQVPQ